jgi:hypothetical protein
MKIGQNGDVSFGSSHTKIVTKCFDEIFLPKYSLPQLEFWIFDKNWSNLGANSGSSLTKVLLKLIFSIFNAF